ncbi:RHS repeat-associated core domain-containing protein [Flavobacterium sp. LHD-85]|uniref:RHS repeat domain-containing protein n=1 Tax=Flavobacterium sp. LHD-85 TaxID=3071410 RepID=UPI0027DF461D|nr:RHS repeat-associated core domain-containing protein [Flavobacterium sp. LHD-85]MDQ6528085.1 RHS repeat-associated core domain-containing protein [Flavobacterium sp. LHD-85]
MEKAGESFSGVKVNYDGKYKKALEVVKASYDTFEVPYYGVDNNDYVNGLGFCCNPSGDTGSGGSPTGKMAKNDNAELQQFYYHPDHLGSSSYITNLDGEVVQHIEYVPFGEVFLEEKNAKWNTPYLFTSKELDRETGMYYFGARYQDPKLSIFISVDPLAEINPLFTPYHYCSNNPINRVDPTGMLDGDYYDSSGNHLGSDGINDNKAYYADSKNADGTFQNARELSVSNSVLNQFANTVAEESSGNWQESFALASSIVNLANYKGKNISSTLQTEGIYGYGNGGNSTKYNGNAEYSMQAAMNAVMGGIDYSNGATRWDGFDLATKGWDHIKSRTVGLGINTSDFNTFKGFWTDEKLAKYSGNKNAVFNTDFKMTASLLTYSPASQGNFKGMVLYNSSAAYGGTIFWKATPTFSIKGTNFNPNLNYEKIKGTRSKPL